MARHTYILNILYSLVVAVLAGFLYRRAPNSRQRVDHAIYIAIYGPLAGFR